MSASERDRAALVRRHVEEGLSQREASERLGIGVRQFKRLVRAWRRTGDAGLVSRQRGRPSNNRLAADRRVEITALLRGKYEGFGPTLAAEKLAAVEGIAVSAETLRQMQIGLGLWRPKTRRAKRVFQVRERRPRFGELIQIDGTLRRTPLPAPRAGSPVRLRPHAWFEGRGPRSTLIVFIDDATGRLTALRFAPVESTRAYLEALREHVLAYGRPLAFYSDRHGIFRVNAKDAASGDGRTEFGWVAARLDIASIHALTPQAKGRVERANQTLQDRLVKELRLMGISSIDAANAVLPQFMAAWNAKFAVEARDGADPSAWHPTAPCAAWPLPRFAHRPWDDTAEAFDDTISRRDERTLSKALTFRADGTVYCVKTKDAGIALRGAKVELRHRLDGTMTVHYKDRILPVTAFNTYAVPDPAEDEKTIDLRIDRIVAARRTAPRTALEIGRGYRRLAPALWRARVAGVTHPLASRPEPDRGHPNLGEPGDILTSR